MVLTVILEGGDLEEERAYMHRVLGERSGSSNEMIIQTPKDSGGNLLDPASLLLHKEVLLIATQVKVTHLDM